MKNCKCFSRKSQSQKRVKNTVSVFGGDFRTVRLDCLGQGERTKFDRFVDPNVRGAAPSIFGSTNLS